MNNKELFDGIWYETKIILKEAIKRGISVKKLAPYFFILKKGKDIQIMHRIDNNFMGKATLKAIGNKFITKYFLSEAGISYSKGKSFNLNNLDEIKEYAKTLKFPIVLKPNWGHRGKQVYPNIKNLKELEEKLILFDSKIREKEVLIEEHFKGEDFRIFVTIKGFYAVLKRVPANVIGDGAKTIKELITEKNKNRGKGIPALKKIKINNKTSDFLKGQGRDLDYVPKKDEFVKLSRIANVTAGGDTIDCTDTAHLSVKKLAFRILKSIPGLNYAGIDILSKDITKEQKPDSYAVIEINNEPGIDMHTYPLKGKSRNVAGALIDLMFPEK